MFGCSGDKPCCGDSESKRITCISSQPVQYCEKGSTGRKLVQYCGRNTDEQVKSEELDETVKFEEWEYHLADTFTKANAWIGIQEVNVTAEEEEVETKDGKYQGQWENGMKHGYGHLRMESCQYKGNWYADAMHGQGVMSWNDGRVYKGFFDQNKFQGFAVMSFPGKVRYVGQYANGLKHGQGAVYWDNEHPKCWAGQFVSGKRHGEGVYTDPDGVISKGVWHNDAQVYQELVDTQVKSDVGKLKHHPFARSGVIPSEEPKPDASKAGRVKHPLPVSYDGVWLCSDTFVEVCRIRADGVNLGKLTWTHKDADLSMWFPGHDWYNRSTHIDSNESGAITMKVHVKDQWGDWTEDQKFVLGQFQNDKQSILFEDGVVWTRGPTEKSPQQWHVVDKGGAIVRSGMNLNNKPSQVGKLKLHDTMTIVDIIGRRAKIVAPKEGWISINSVETNRLTGQHFQVAVPSNLPGKVVA